MDASSEVPQKILPFFAASGHNLYAKSAYIYLQQMLQLADSHLEVYNFFRSGYHVVRRSDRYWSGLSLDLVVEQTLMKTMKTTGGLTRGHGMAESHRTQWLLSMPACSTVNAAMQKLTEADYVTSTKMLLQPDSQEMTRISEVSLTTYNTEIHLSVTTDCRALPQGSLLTVL